MVLHKYLKLRDSISGGQAYKFKFRSDLSQEVIGGPVNINEKQRSSVKADFNKYLSNELKEKKRTSFGDDRKNMKKKGVTTITEIAKIRGQQREQATRGKGD